MAYITQFYSWATGNTITAARLNGNITNLVDGLSAGTKDINIAKLQIGGNDIIDSSENITFSGDMTGSSTTASKPVWTLKNTNADANSAELQFYKLSASAADNDDVGKITFYGDDDGGGKTLYGQILAESTDVTDTTEDGKITIYTMTAGTSTATLTMESGAATFGGALTVTGAATFTGGVTFNGGITLGAGDDLIGSSTSDIVFNTNKFTVAGATGNTVIAGTLGVTGVGTFTAESVHNAGLTDGTATLDGSGAWTGITSLVVDDITVNGNTISSAGASSLTITATAGQNVSIESVTLDGGVVAGVSNLTMSGTLDLGTNTILDGSMTGDWDLGTGDITTGGKLVLDVDGTAENADGSLTLGAGNDAGIFFDGTDLVFITNGAGAGGIKLDSEDDTVEILGSGVTQATFSTGGLNIVSGDDYSIAGTSVLTATTLGSGVTASSLTSVGTLTSLTVSGDVTFDTTTLFVDASQNNVGIGTVSPPSNRLLYMTSTFAKIELKASDDSIALFILDAGATSDAYISLEDNNASVWSFGMDSTDSNAFTISASGVPGSNNRLRITTAGVVGIPSIPTSASGLASGDLWNNSGVVNVV